MQTEIQLKRTEWRSDFRATFALALPLILAEVGWMSMGIVDTIMVGRLPNSAIAIGATGLGQSLYMSIAVFGASLLLGLDTFVAHAYGREDLNDARHSLVNGIALALVLIPVVMLAILQWPALMAYFGISPELVGPMRGFLWALNWGTPPLLGYFTLRRYLQAMNVVHPIMFALVSANIINAVFDWMFIYGHLGFPAMGIAGSGWATAVARVYMFVVVAITLVWVEAKHGLSAWKGKVHFELQRVIALLKLGIPAALQIILEMGAFAAGTALCARLGPLPLSGHEIALSCASFTFMVPLGVSSAAAVRVGQQLGRGDPQGARRAGWSAILLGVAFMACSGLVFVSAPRTIARLFTPDPLVVEMGAKLILVAAAFQLFDGLQIVGTGALRGSGDTRTSMLANLVAYWVIGLPLGCVLGFKLGWGPFGIWIGLCIGLMVVGSVLLYAWHKRDLTAHHEAMTSALSH